MHHLDGHSRGGFPRAARLLCEAKQKLPCCGTTQVLLHPTSSPVNTASVTYVTFLLPAITRYKLLFADWRGYLDRRLCRDLDSESIHKHLQPFATGHSAGARGDQRSAGHGRRNGERQPERRTWLRVTRGSNSANVLPRSPALRGRFRWSEPPEVVAGDIS